MNVTSVEASHVNDLQDVAVALEVKSGVDGSAVATSHDYKLRNLPAQDGDYDAGAVEIRALKFQSDQATGTAPMIVASTTVVSNLNADQVDGLDSGDIVQMTGNQTIAGIKTFSSAPVLPSGIGFVPSGCILMWSGAISAIPSGWNICDGNNSTPNLTDRFVLDADADAAGTNDVGDSGGSRTISEANMPSHSHTLRGGSSGTAGYPSIQSDGEDYQRTGTADSIQPTGSGTDYLPKYYALAYIMKS